MSLTARRLREERRGGMGTDEDQTKGTQPERSTHVFDPWLRCRLLALETMGDYVAGRYYQLAGTRKRAPKQSDLDNVARVVEAVLTNLMFAASSGHNPPSVAVSLGASKRRLTRYDARGFAILPTVLEVLSGRLGGLDFTLMKSDRRGIASSIIPVPGFGALNGRGDAASNFPIHTFYQAPGAELVVLTRTEKDYVQNTRQRELIDYPDNSVADRLRADVEQINTFLADASMAFEPDGGLPVPIGQRRLQRFFSLLPEDRNDEPRFDQGGRLFGGWWQNLPKERRGSIRLEGEAIADLDFSSMFLRLAYLDAGREPPEGDLYREVRGFGDPRWRDGVKKIVNAMLFRSTPMVRLPRDPELATLLPPATVSKDIRSAILEAHPALVGTFESGAGFRLMFRESEILVAALLRLKEKGVPALPMHDGIMVPQSKAATAEDCLRDAAQHVTGFRLPISMK